MKGALFLGWRYLAYHKLKTGVLLASVTLMLFLPAAVRFLVQDSAAALTARAESTPLLVGAKGSSLELVLNALYFHAERPPVVPYQVFEDVRDSKLAEAIPLYTRFHSRDAPIVGTSLGYFPFRKLKFAEGRMMGVLGECVVGANVARKRNAGLGASLVSSPETVFDIAGVYPLKMQVVGVLEPTGTVDDDAIFVDIRTTWIIQGLGHGHQDLEAAGAGGAVLSRGEGTVTANASLVQYAQITASNVQEFHFHGAAGDFPLSAVIAVPPGEKQSTLLRGRYQAADMGEQLIVPKHVLDDLLQTVFTVQNYVILGLVMLSLATVAVITLVFLLSQQLRKGEIGTLKRMGASRPFVATLILSEIGFVFAGSLVLAFLMTLAVRYFSAEILMSLMTL
jgi:putative ABC transport system permease protein